MAKNIQIIIKVDDKEEPIFESNIPLTFENLNGIKFFTEQFNRIENIVPKNVKSLFEKEKIDKLFKKIKEYFESKPLIDKENAIEDFPPFTEQEIDEALDILEIVKELYKYRC